MRNIAELPAFRPLVSSDLTMLHSWLLRPHVAEWWGEPENYEEVEREYLPLVAKNSTSRGYISLLNGNPIGFIQSYVVMDSGQGWWEQETDTGARGLDQFLANPEQLGCGIGTAMVTAFATYLFQDPAVTKLQTDPSPENERAIRCYRRAGFSVQGHVSTPGGAAILMVRYRAGYVPQKSAI